MRLTVLRPEAASRFLARPVAVGAAALALLTAAGESHAQLVPLDPPTGRSLFGGGFGDSREIFITALSNFSISSLGFEIDPIGNPTLTAEVYAASGLTPGALLASQSLAFTDTGVLQYYDVPIAFSFVAGQEYALRIAITTDAAANFFNYDNPTNNPANFFTAGGVIQGREGTADSFQSNFLLAPFRVNVVGANAGAAPEAGTVTLLGMGLLSAAGTAAVRARKRRGAKA